MVSFGTTVMNDKLKVPVVVSLVVTGAYGVFGFPANTIDDDLNYEGGEVFQPAGQGGSIGFVDVLPRDSLAVYAGGVVDYVPVPVTVESS
jgi:hypothetical protein